MGNVLSKLNNACICCCKSCRCCCKSHCLTEQEKIQIIYDQINTDDIWDSTI